MRTIRRLPYARPRATRIANLVTPRRRCDDDNPDPGPRRPRRARARPRRPSSGTRRPRSSTRTRCGAATASWPRRPARRRHRQFTGRSPKDKFVVAEPGSEDRIWWGEINQPLAEDRFDGLRAKVVAHLDAQDPLYVVDAFAGADPAHRIAVRVITGSPYHALFAKTMFITPTRRGARVVRARRRSCCTRPRSRPIPEQTAPARARSSSSTRRSGEVLIGGTFYAGEIKKAIFTVMNDRLPLEGVLPMHCSANVGEDGKVAVFFGLSGTGKTTLSADPERSLIGDDEHGWGVERRLQHRGRLLRKGDPALGRGRAGDLPDDEDVRHGARERRRRRARRRSTRTTTRRPRTRVPRTSSSGSRMRCRTKMAGHPSAVVMLTADAFGILPPIARLTPRPGALLLPLRLHRQARRHRDRRPGAAADVLDVLRRAVPPAAARRLRAHARREARRARRRRSGS